jgi:hypothetical protein
MATRVYALLDIRGKLKARNRTQQPLHMVLAYFTMAYGIHILKNDPIDPGEAWVNYLVIYRKFLNYSSARTSLQSCCSWPCVGS